MNNLTVICQPQIPSPAKNRRQKNVGCERRWSCRRLSLKKLSEATFLLTFSAVGMTKRGPVWCRELVKVTLPSRASTSFVWAGCPEAAVCVLVSAGIKVSLWHRSVRCRGMRRGPASCQSNWEHIDTVHARPHMFGQIKFGIFISLYQIFWIISL